MKVKIVDAICGAGKTSALINKINEDNSNSKYLYITPFLSEVTRIKTCCKSKNFKEPESKGGLNKSAHIIKLFERGENIVSTHALFHRINTDCIEIIKRQNYILIMDEVADVVDTIDISKNDLNLIVRNYIKIEENIPVKWTNKEYTGKLLPYKEIIENNHVFCYFNKKKQVKALIRVFPIEIFNAFKDAYILTYMFDGQIQKYYYDIHNVQYEYLYIKDMHLTKEKTHYDEKEIKSLISICNKPKINEIGNENSAFSVSWFPRNTSKYEIIKRNSYNYVRNDKKVSFTKVIWTTFKSYKKDIQIKGFSKSFLPINIRATNEYQDRTTVVYLANRYLQPIIKNFFIQHKVPVDEEAYALSELIQFLFRSAIRKNEKVDVYIPSARMRRLLKKWLDKK